MTRRLLPALLALFVLAAPASAGPIHTTYLWHMHQPIYWPDRSGWNGHAYEFAYETITLGSAQNDVFSIFNNDDRVQDYQNYPKDALGSILWSADGGAQISFAGSLIQNVQSLASAGWNGGRYASNWTSHYRTAQGWSTSGGRRRLDLVNVAFHHSINPLVDDAVFRKMIQAQRAIMPGTWGSPTLSTGFFPAEMCFSTRLIPALVDEGITWSVVPDVHFARACADYPAAANLDNCDPPNPADRINPAQGFYYAQSISRGVTTRVPVPYALRPHYAQYVDPSTGVAKKLVVVPAASAMSWNEGYGTYGTGEIDAIAGYNDPAKPMLILFAHDGDNAWAGGNSYYTQNVNGFSSQAAGQGYRPSTVAEYLADFPVDVNDIVHVEDGGWVNADGDFGSPQFINWNWPLVNASGQFDIPAGWAEDERNWAVLTAAVNRVLTAEQLAGAPDIARVVDPTLPGATAVEHAWHFLLSGHESGYMYYGTALDMEVKPTLAANQAAAYADPVIGTGAGDLTGPTLWIPQRLPWNPGGYGGGALWGYPGGQGAVMSQDFHVWTFAYDVNGLSTVRLKYRVDADGANPLASVQNETWAGGAEVGAWQSMDMTFRDFPAGNVYNNPSIDFFVMPTYVADQYTAHVTGFEDVLLDYYVEAVDGLGNVRKSPIQHVYVGSGGTSGGTAVTWTPENPVAGETVTITYDAVPGTLPDGTNPVYIHIGHSGWTEVLNPDPAMTWDAGDARWMYTYSIPGAATAVDFVFQNGAGAWDNNGGADWHVPVTGAEPPPHVIDGALDAGTTAVATCGGAALYADYDGRWIYLAVPVSAAAGLDRFVFVAHESTTGTRGAPWAKAGTVALFDRMLGNETTNNWAGWFTGTETLTTAGVQGAAGTVLEGLVDAEAVWGTAPASVRVAFAAYGNPDGGALGIQSPCGDGDGNLEAAEWVTLSAPATGIPDDGGRLDSRVRLLSGNPSRGRVHATIEAPAGVPVRADLFDARGRRVAALFDGASPGRIAVDWRPGPADRAPGAGVYFLRVRIGSETTARRVVVLP